MSQFKEALKDIDINIIQENVDDNNDELNT